MLNLQCTVMNRLTRKHGIFKCKPFYLLFISFFENKVLGQVQQLLGRVPRQGSLTAAYPLHLAWILALYRLLFKHQNQVFTLKYFGREHLKQII